MQRRPVGGAVLSCPGEASFGCVCEAERDGRKTPRLMAVSDPATSAVTHQTERQKPTWPPGAATLPQSKSPEESIQAALCAAAAAPRAKPDCVVSHKRVISGNAFHASELQPTPG